MRRRADSLSSAFLAVLFAAPLLGAEPALAPADARQSRAADCQRALFARQALDQDRALVVRNLGVSVRSNVATLWGSVPSAALARRAEAIVRDVPGIAAVRNELQVELAKSAVNNLFGPPTVPPLGEPAPQRPVQPAGALAGRPFEAKPSESVPATPPIVISLRPPLPPDPPATVVPVSAKAAANVEAAVDRVRSADARFRQVRPVIAEGVVRLRGQVPRGEDMYELAQRLSAIPGVKRVIIEEVQTPPQRRPLTLP